MQTDPHQLSRRVLDRITRDGLMPRPRWEFVFKNYVFWTLGACAVALGALAFSAGLFEVQNAGWRYYAATHEDFASFFFGAAPFLWALALGLFILLGYINIRRTEHGYRYPLSVIALGAVLTSIALGTALYAAGLGAEIEESIGDHPPFYRPVIVEQRVWWLAPEKGLLGGEVLSLATDTASFELRDFSGTTWTVSSADLAEQDRALVARGGTVRIVGAPATTTNGVFHACFVFPWEVYGAPRGKIPQPIGIFKPENETSATATRTEICKGIRPYQALRVLDEGSY